jgi:hypothetical protein
MAETAIGATLRSVPDGEDFSAITSLGVSDRRIARRGGPRRGPLI